MTDAAQSTIQGEARFDSIFPKGYICAHSRLIEPARQLASVACNPAGGECLLVVGPHGVGRKALATYTSLILKKSFEHEIEQDAFHQPCLELPLLGRPSAAFSWPAYYRQAVAASGLQIDARPHVPPWRMSDSSLSSETAYLQLLQALSAKLVIVSNGTELMLGGSPYSAFRNWSHVARLAEFTGVPHAVFGDYRLLALSGVTPDAATRQRIIHFARYSSSERAYFAQTVERFSKRVQQAIPEKLALHTDLLAERSNGCIGTLRDWVHRAVVYAKRNKRSSVGLAELEETAPTKIGALQANEEAIAGEAVVAAAQTGDVAKAKAYLSLMTHSDDLTPAQRAGMSLSALLNSKPRNTELP